MRLSFCRPVFALVTTSSDDTGSSTLVGTVYGLVVIMERGFGNSLFFLKRHYQPTSFVKSLPLMWWPLWLPWGYFGTTFSSLNVNAFPALSRPGATLQVMQWARGGGGGVRVVRGVGAGCLCSRSQQRSGVQPRQVALHLKGWFGRPCWVLGATSSECAINCLTF